MMKLTDIVPIKEWVSLEKSVHEMSGLNASVFDVEGIRITDYHEWVNALCPEVKANKKGQDFICAVAHQNLATMAKNTREPVIEECDAGIVKIVVPIFVKDRFIGAFGACGLLLEGGEVDDYLIHVTTGIAEEKIQALSPSVGSIAMEKAEQVAAYVQKEIDRLINDA